MFAAGSQIGKYTLRRKLGQGGFGSVFAGYDESLDREVAVKILNAEHKADDDVMRRFLQEARLAARIGHPGITTMFECAQLADGTAYIAMELLDGESLAHRLHRSGRLAATSAMEITRQLASGLEAAHRAGIVHRDLKPDNIFLVKDPAVPGGERVKILDFGIAKLHHVQSSDVHTQTSEVFGTPRYMSPEQCRSSTQIDGRSDIYTLGCIAFELLTGRPPFVGQTGELFAQHLMVEAPNVLSVVRETPYHVTELVQRMLAKDVNARPQSMADVQRQLEAGGAISAGVPATLPPGSSGQAPIADSTLKAAAGVSVMLPPAKLPRMVIAVAASAAILLAIVVVLLLRGSGESQQPAIAAAPPVVVVEKAPPPPKPTIAPIEPEAPKPPPVEEPPVKKPRKKTDKPVVEPKQQTIDPYAEQQAAMGTLVLRSTPPCEILVDGKAVAASTPTELKLVPGKHRVTLVHDEKDIKETFAVQIKAGQTERVTKDLTDKVNAKKRNATINPFGGGS
jgi:eukaryotic-like serine/threonine-protein kinase